jgi:hypothetical protein
MSRVVTPRQLQVLRAASSVSAPICDNRLRPADADIPKQQKGAPRIISIPLCHNE